MYLRQAVRQVFPSPLGKEVLYLRQAVRQLLPRQALSFPLRKLAIYCRQAVRQALTFLLGKEAVCQQAVRFPMPPRWQVGSNSPFPWGRRQSSGFPASRAGIYLPPARGNSFKAGQSGSQGTRSGRHSARQRALQASQGNCTASQADSAGTWDSNPIPHTPNRPPQGSCPEDPNLKWVINLSNKPLTPAQRSVLAKGPNFAVSPKQPANVEYITAIEAACTKLSQQDAEELRAEVNRVLRSSHPQTQPN